MEPTENLASLRLSDLCTGQGVAGAGAQFIGATCEGTADDGYFHLDLQPLGMTFPFMGRVQDELYISSNGYISFSGEQTGDSGQASNPETTVIPSAGAKPDDSIFVYWTDFDFTNSGEIYVTPGAEQLSNGDTVGTLTVSWVDAPYYCHGSNGEGATSPADYGPAWYTSANCIGKTASFQATLYEHGVIRQVYKDVDSFASPAWAPVSIGLESADGFDGIQVAYDDHDWPRSGTAIGFAHSCGEAGENDCGADDIARATVSCLTFSAAHPECIGGYGIAPASCAEPFCSDPCYNEVYNLNEDCVDNARSTMDADDKSTVRSLVPPQLLAVCSPPDSGTADPAGGGGRGGGH